CVAPGAVCVNSPPGVYSCTCTSPACIDGNECNSNTCDELATCIELDGGYRCQCLPGYTGDGITCSNIDECLLGLDSCSTSEESQEECTDTNGLFVCTCSTNGKGELCGDINECITIPNVCTTNAVCTNLYHSSRCDCETGFIQMGEDCIDINECQLDIDDCDTNALCINTLGSYICGCNQGYTGAGTVGTCTDLDECASSEYNTCAVQIGAECSNSIGGYDCICTSGCIYIDECSLMIDECDVNADCTDTLAGYTCT
ncbi:unnamed protein product, partial [Owenia fusiformis]